MNTIAALATPMGRSAIGVLRLSGDRAWSIAGKLIGESFEPSPGGVTVKDLRDPSSEEIIDRAVLTFFKSPNSFTGEDIVEISCHGSPIILRQVLDVVLKLGACLAEPGEFSFRALTNGKINLSQAEAIRDLIDARTTAAAKQASRQLHGELSLKVTPTKNKLIEIIVVLESALEFSEDDLPAWQSHSIRTQLKSIISDVGNLAATYSVGHLVQEGIKLAIIGRPNVGKSSLFNSLVGLDRAIVTPLPGTTRDSINEQVSWEGVPILLTDTAGIRESIDEIEGIGIERTKSAIADADLILLVIDGSSDLEKEDLEALSLTKNARRIIVLNKSDLPTFADRFDRGEENGMHAEVSATSGEGLGALRTAILKTFGDFDTENVGLLVTNARHNDLLCRTEAQLRVALELLDQKASEEVIVIGLHNALTFLGEITGETTAEDILHEIFATFCIGK